MGGVSAGPMLSFEKLLMYLDSVTPVPVEEVLKRKATQSKILS